MSSPVTSSSTATAGAAAASKICFNPQCKEAVSEAPHRKGWRLRSGELARICDRCSFAYEQGSFCETFHSDAAGWRSCETCAKRVHCGCIVSAVAYLLLDTGGVECVQCARKAFSMVSDKPKDFSVRSWNMSMPFPGQWRQAPHMWGTSGPQSELQQRLSYELDRPNSTRRLITGRHYTVSLQEKKSEDMASRIPSSNIIHVVRDGCANGNTNLDSVSACKAFHVEQNANAVQSGNQVGENDPMSTRSGVISDPLSCSAGINFGSKSNPCLNSQSIVVKDDPSSPVIGLAVPFSSVDDINDPQRVSTSEPQLEAASPFLAKNIYANPQHSIDSYGEIQAQIRNGRPGIDAQRNQLLPRYWPRITEQELQQISGNSNSVITPLFEKVLSASDAGRIGRLVLPKKCAEAYFPPISHSEGQPLKVQDATGKEWVFQFRFWPNNNSRMYVLEGVTPCIQSMQLQAGDTVTFSRIDPEGKLIMGFRKACGISTEQENQTLKDGNGIVKPPEVNNQIPPNEFIASLLNQPLKSSAESRNPINTGTWPRSDKAGFIQKDGPGGKSSGAPTRRKGGTFGSRSKRLRIDSEESIQLKLTWEEAQELLRPPPNHVPNIVVIDGHEFEEFEEAPVLGKPTIFATNQAGDKNQWAQCEDCLKWRKLPRDALLPSRWTCSDNKWDPERSSCSSAQELSTEQLADLLSPAKTKTGASKRSRAKLETDSIELSDGLDTLANLAILGEGESLPSASQPTTRHPRHRPGCTCIVCIQPPSGKGPKHKPTCTCNVCLTVKRRFQTLMLKREKRQSEKEAETSRKQKQQQQQLVHQSLPRLDFDPLPIDRISTGSPKKQMASDEGIIVDESERRKQLSSPLKARIDLNIQPEWEEDPSPAGSLMALLPNATS